MSQTFALRPPIAFTGLWLSLIISLRFLILIYLLSISVDSTLRTLIGGNIGYNQCFGY